MSNEINRPAPPALPLSPSDYDRRWSDQVHSVLRLFFNQLVSSYRTVISRDNGGRYLYFPHGKFYRNTTQAVAVVDTAETVTFTTTVDTFGVTLASGSRIGVEQPGFYSFKYHGHLVKSTASASDIIFWFRKNGTDIDGTAQKITVIGDNASQILDLSLIIELASDDYVEVVLSSGSTDVSLVAVAATASLPAISSSRVDVAYVSNV